MGEHAEEGHEGAFCSGPCGGALDVGIGVVEGGTLAYLEFFYVGDEGRGAEEEMVQAFAAMLEESGFLLRGGGLEGDLCEEMESGGGEPGMGHTGTGTERGGVVVEVVDDEVDQLLGECSSHRRKRQLSLSHHIRIRSQINFYFQMHGHTSASSAENKSSAHSHN